MSDTLVEVINLHRTFEDVKAVRGVSFSLKKGETVGFIGANGAGKTTTMRIMALLDAPERGRVMFEGKNALEYGTQVRAKIGWMPDSYGAYEYMTIREYLDFFARAYGYRGAVRRDRVAEVMGFTELGPIAERYVDTLSKGMGQRLCLGRALLNDPELLILDEPAAGLDPQARMHFKHLVRLMADEGKTLLISSHILSELEDMCDTMLFIDEGKIVHHGAADSLKRNSDGLLQIQIKVSGDPEKLHEWLLLQQGVEVQEAIEGGFRFSLPENGTEELSQLLRRAVSEGLEVYCFNEQQRRLEDVFVELVEKKGEESK